MQMDLPKGARPALRRSSLCVACLIALPLQAQTICPSPVTVTDTPCTVTPGTVVNVAASQTGVAASGPGGAVTADQITINLTGSSATGVLVDSGAIVTTNGSTIGTTSTAASAMLGQTGLRATGGGSRITGTGTRVTLGPPLSGAANNLRGVSAEAGASVTLSDSEVTVQAGSNALGSHAVQATGAGSLVSLTRGALQTTSRSAFGAAAFGGGSVTLSGTSVTTSGAQNTTTLQGSHALYASDAGSAITAKNVTATVTGTLANALRADNGGRIEASGVTLSSSGAGTVLNPAAVARATAGGRLLIGVGSTLTGTGQYGYGVHVDGEGSQAEISDVAISVSGSRTAGLALRAGGDADVEDSTISAQAAASPAVYIEGEGSTLQLDNTRLTAALGTSYGVLALGGSTTITGGSIETSGDYGAAMTATNATIAATDVAISTTGNNNAMGALADLGGRVTITRGTITTTGTQVAAASFPHAMTARNPGGTLVASGTRISTGGLAMGAVSDDGGTSNLTDVEIVTRGARANGLYSVVEQNGAQFSATLTALRGSVETFGATAHGAAAQARNDLPGPLASVAVTDSRITTHGDGAVGLRASLAAYGTSPTGRGEARVVATNATVRTQGAQAHGAVSRDAPTSVTLDGGSILTSGQNADGAMADIGGHIIGIGTRVQADGAQSMGLYVTGTPTAISRGDFTGSTIVNTSGPTIGVAGNGAVALTDSSAGGSGEWLRVGTSGDYPPRVAAEVPLPGPGDFPDEDGVPPPPPPDLPAPVATPSVPGLADVTATRSVVTGSAFTAAGSVSNLTLVDATWNLTGSSNLTNLVNDPSLIDFSAPQDGAFKTLTVVNYSGDGTIALNTVLGGDDSPSDTLVVDGGTASGPSLLRIKPAGGDGAVTMANGILVVDAINGATTTTGAFALDGRVVAGPYEYTLQRSSVDASAPQSWFLRSTIDCSAPGAPAPPCPAPPAPPAPPPPVPPPEPPEPVPNYRREVSLYASAVPTAMHYGRSLLDTLHERVGEQELLRGRADLQGQENLDGMWGRLVYVDGERDSRRGIYGDGPSYDYTLGAVQIGYDLYRHEEPGKRRDHAGLYGAVGYARTDVEHYDGTPAGEDRIDAYTLGGYWTRYDARDDSRVRDAWYVDTVLQATWYDVAANPHEGLPRMETDGWGAAASLEGGYPFRLGDGWQLEPQGQVIYQWFDFDDASDPAARVRFDDTTSLVGRLSARLSRDWVHHRDPERPLHSSGWMRLGVWHEFEGEPVTSFSSDDGDIPFQADLGGTWWEIELGATRELGRNVFAYGNLGYSQGFDDDRRAWEGKLGVRANW